ncbi:9863_t:CDS:10 [Paraglomus brasilianum]|uniref:GDP-Man:Man(3)GlcNAc(2)-PP-Dol alpha-1,2-mannosyltransferase n=1 Tax=Paraglomus brasilianum TaxID=144538 RepID=A0A9N9BIC6_9GLOM|nr:9863_t:CDS:10 [Paraglomus brasilianum]
MSFSLSNVFFVLATILTILVALSYYGITILKRILAQNAKVNRNTILSTLRPNAEENPVLIIGFFHPYCNAGGGGERVLWTIIRIIQETYPHVVCAIYTGDVDVKKEDILQKVKARFNIVLNQDTLTFVHLKKRSLVEDKRYPRFTLLGQSLGSIFLGWEALNKLVPDMFFDTMGYAFTYPLVKYLTSCKVAAYVHYPTISSDMLNKVHERRSGFNNNEAIANSFLYSDLKLMLYSLAGTFADVIMVNSSWTKGHIDNLWSTSSKVVFPPCDTTAFSRLPIEDRANIIVSVAQFRPEKDHQLQLKALQKFLQKYAEFRTGPAAVTLVLIGSSRNESDELRVKQLKEQCKKLNIENNVIFETNAPFAKLIDWMSKAKVGIHTMWNEHFGIGIVEYMAGGVIPLAHNSGGPKMDIVVSYKGNKTGFLANDDESYASALHTIFTMSALQLQNIQINARQLAMEKFSENVFKESMLDVLESILSESRDF